MMRNIVYIEGRREGYSEEQISETMTVRELIDYLEEFDDDAVVLLKNDNGYTFGSITWDSFEEEYKDVDDDEEDERVVNKREFLESLSEEELNKGYFKFNISNKENLESLNGEGVWGWASPEEYERYDDDNYFGKIIALLCNDPFNYYGKLRYGSEVVLKCNGNSRPILDPDWVRKHLL